MTELISVIVATYNRPDALDAVLRSLAGQGDRQFEVIVADDGSGPQTAQVVSSSAARCDIPIKHVRHEDRGFRLAEIRNRAILQSAGGLCIFLDGDCIARPSFVAAHRRLAEPGWLVSGNRVMVDRALSERILADQLRPEAWGAAQWIAAWRSGSINRLAPLLALPLGPLRRIHAGEWEGARGCNLAIRRDDLMRLDGFDAAFNGWGLEDSDIIIRLIRSGVRRKDGRFATGVLHLWHPDGDRAKLADNQARLDEVSRADRIRALRGLSALDACSDVAPEAERIGSLHG